MVILLLLNGIYCHRLSDRRKDRQTDRQTETGIPVPSFPVLHSFPCRHYGIGFVEHWRDVRAVLGQVGLGWCMQWIIMMRIYFFFLLFFYLFVFFIIISLLFMMVKCVFQSALFCLKSTWLARFFFLFCFSYPVDGLAFA